MEKDSTPKFYKLKVIIKITLYTIISSVILLFCFELFTKNMETEPISSSYGLAPSSTYEADPQNGTIALLLIFITVIIYTILFIRELKSLEKYKKKILKYVLVAYFQILTLIWLLFYSVAHTGGNSLLNTVMVNTTIGGFLDSINMYLLLIPPIILSIVNAIKCIKDIINFFISKTKKYES